MNVDKRNNIIFTDTKLSELDLLICSDIHFDSLKCDHASFKAHLDTIKEKNGQIIIVGDMFDVMGCHKDPRSKAADINPKYLQRGRSYLDLVVEDTYEFLKPYKENILTITYGNHETAILKHRDTDILDRLVYLLNQHPGKQVIKGDYAGWVLINMVRKGSNDTRQFRIAYHHGKGGSAKRSKGILYSQMDAMEYPDAHMIVSGHDHNKLYDPSNVRRRIAGQKNMYTYNDTVHWLKTGSYKRSSDSMGWEVEKGFHPKRLGGWFVKLTYTRQQVKRDFSYISPTVTEAKPLHYAIT